MNRIVRLFSLVGALGFSPLAIACGGQAEATPDVAEHDLTVGKPASPTNQKVIACARDAVSATLSLDASQGRHGTLVIVRKPSADRNDPPSATVAMVPDQFQSAPDRIYLEGRQGEQDYYANMLKTDFQRGGGTVVLNLQWAQNGQQWSIGGSCAFTPR